MLLKKVGCFRSLVQKPMLERQFWSCTYINPWKVQAFHLEEITPINDQQVVNNLSEAVAFMHQLTFVKQIKLQ